MLRVLWSAVLITLLAGCAGAPMAPQAQTAAQPAVSGEALASAGQVIPAAARSIAVVDIPVAGSVEQPASVPPAAIAAAAYQVAGTPTPAAGQLAEAPPAGAINPLTGLIVDDPANLTLAPALVSITNFPVSARPQAGLSFSPFVFEMYVGEGMTRFLALFYGDYPVKGETASSESALALSDDRIGPVRSGRLPYESVRQLYQGFLVMASASANVKSSLGQYTNVFGSDNSDINSALIPATRLAEIAAKNPKRLDPGALNVLKFDASAPAGGRDAHSLWIPYNYLNQVLWRYDPASGSYLRYQDNADGVTFKQATDRLTGEPLTYENVVVLFANHSARAETLVDIDLMYLKRMPALLFRDGQMYEIYWTTANTDYEKRTGQVRPIRFVDAQGNPFALKPGQTWVQMVQAYTPYNESVESERYADLKYKRSAGSGHWAVQFFAPRAP